ncbi:MAG: Indole-3-glycerol phosphate synthase [uncultured Phycisphaerae bacterium]|uniref:Indole-3-glycerol phosphate synthase n=1 Tax=uncultured Phycisphaerae bacterium TaxID=904963 RepID=A0A6J4N7Z1_9BACT|nr:MAG: Indole-3-glycerol phosphate synthase [uncultured Phycisphaerae bacterium]
MSTILDKIVATKREEVAERLVRTPVDALKERVRSLPRPRNFFHAVTHKGNKPIQLIAEVKKASPSAGVIREDFDPVAIATAYKEAGADAISCLTDEKYFQGSLDYLTAIHEAVDLPVLRKDFIIDPYQVWEARAAGADAVLLIAECLQVNELIDLQILATELNLTTLIEVHDMENLIRVRDRVIGFPHRSYSLLGINNRDLRTFKTDLGTTLRMAELVEDRSVLVSESGINTARDVQKLADAGVAAVLVGESLMRSPDIKAKVRELFPAKGR